MHRIKNQQKISTANQSGLVCIRKNGKKSMRLEFLTILLITRFLIIRELWQQVVFLESVSIFFAVSNNNHMALKSAYEVSVSISLS